MGRAGSCEVSCDRSTLASANAVAGDTLALSSWSLFTATVLPGHLPKAGGVTLESGWAYKKSPRINEIRTRSCTAGAFGFLVLSAAL